MKKMMFNSRYGLEEAVVERRKTKTRRNTPKSLPETIRQGYDRLEIFNGKELRCYNEAGSFIKYNLPYQIGEVVAVAQSYKDMGYDPNALDRSPKDISKIRGTLGESAGWNNKLFVRAEACRHQIRITNVRVERLNEITDDDCIAEGIGISDTDNRIGYPFGIPFNYYIGEDKEGCRYSTPREAYAALIDRISGKGTWQSNPWCLAYDFELVK